MKKKIKSNVIIIAISITVAIIGIVLAIVFDLYGYIGTVGGIILNICIFFGVFGILEIDDWTIWYKRLLIKKYNDTEGTLDIKVYDQGLHKHYKNLPCKVKDYYISNDQCVIFVMTIHLDTLYEIYTSINYFTNGVTIVDKYGQDYKCNKIQYSYPDNELLNVYMEDFNKYLSTNLEMDDKLTINPDSLTYNLKK